jgi:hypothetical protein
MRFFDLDDIALKNIFSIISYSRKFLNFRFVCSEFKAHVEDNTKLELEGVYKGPTLYIPETVGIRLIRIDPSLELPRKRPNSNSTEVSVVDLRNSQLSNCIKKVSLQLYGGFKQTIDSINDFASILNRQTDFAISFKIDIHTPEPSSLVQSGESLSELIPMLRLVSFENISTRPFPNFTEDLIKFYLRNSIHLQKLKLNSIDVLESVLQFLIQTDQTWSNLKCLDIHATPPQNIMSGGIPNNQVAFSQNVVALFSHPRIAKKIPNLEELNIDTWGCATDLNGLSKLTNLKSIKLVFRDCGFTQDQCNLIFNPCNFQQKVKSVESFSMHSNYCSDGLIRRLDFILEQFNSLRRLEIGLCGESDQNYLISSLRNGSLNKLESLDIINHRYSLSFDSRLPPLFCTDPIDAFCPKLVKLSIELSNKSTFTILSSCSESIKQVAVKSHQRHNARMVNQLINRLDSNQHIENIICSIEWETQRLGHILRKFSKEIRSDVRNEHEGICLMKLQNNLLIGSLMWKTESQKKRKIHIHAYDSSRL